MLEKIIMMLLLVAVPPTLEAKASLITPTITAVAPQVQHVKKKSIFDIKGYKQIIVKDWYPENHAYKLVPPFFAEGDQAMTRNIQSPNKLWVATTRIYNADYFLQTKDEKGIESWAPITLPDPKFQDGLKGLWTLDRYGNVNLTGVSFSHISEESPEKTFALFKYEFDKGYERVRQKYEVPPFIDYNNIGRFYKLKYFKVKLYGEWIKVQLKEYSGGTLACRKDNNDIQFHALCEDDITSPNLSIDLFHFDIRSIANDGTVLYDMYVSNNFINYHYHALIIADIQNHKKITLVPDTRAGLYPEDLFKARVSFDGNMLSLPKPGGFYLIDIKKMIIADEGTEDYSKKFMFLFQEPSIPIK